MVPVIFGPPHPEKTKTLLTVAHMYLQLILVVTLLRYMGDPKPETLLTVAHMVGCQNYGPFLGTLNIRGRIIIGTQKGTIIFDNQPYVSTDIPPKP